MSLLEKFGGFDENISMGAGLRNGGIASHGVRYGSRGGHRWCNVGKVGWSYGTVVGRPSEDDASAGALEKCRSSRDAAANPKLRKACVVTRTFHDQCAAIAMDPGAGTPGVGWAIAPTMQAAETQAIANCRETAGPSRQKVCQTAINNGGDNVGQAAVNCDGSAK